MSSLEAIAIKVEGGAPPSAGNAEPVLHEIRHALARLRTTGESGIIDLTAMPFGPGDRDRLMAVLGEGEVSAKVAALGETRIRETAFPGVWWVDYLSPNGSPLTTHIEIAPIPSLLATPAEALADSLHRLESRLQPPEQRQE